VLHHPENRVDIRGEDVVELLRGGVLDVVKERLRLVLHGIHQAVHRSLELPFHDVGHRDRRRLLANVQVRVHDRAVGMQAGQLTGQGGISRRGVEQEQIGAVLSQLPAEFAADQPGASGDDDVLPR
jgi:hypothetical protein